MAFRFERFEVWQLARTFTNCVYEITRDFPRDEIFGLTSQLRRASCSVALNIAEGSDRGSDVEFARFLRMALASLEEVVTALYIAKDQEFIRISVFQVTYDQADALAAKLRGFIKTLKERSVQQ
ncbi:MAG: four helix bundle protein [Candidatus Uhrbacteria bacterium]